MENKNKRITSRIAIALACILMPLGVLGFGYFIGEDKEYDKKVANTLTVGGEIGGTVVNTQDADIDGIVPGDTISKTINIKPNATAPSLLRVKIEPSWYDGHSQTTLPVSNIKFIYTNDIVKNNFDADGNNYWYKSDDGYLYYMDSVTKREEAMELVKGIKFLGGDNDTDSKEYQGKNLKITVTMNMIQCKYTPYKTRWGIEDNSQLYNKLKVLCLESDKSIEE